MIVDAHAHLWGAGFLPAGFYRDTAEAWARKAPGRTAAMIMPRLLDGVVDEDGDLFVANMDRAGVDTSLVMMIDVGVHHCGEEPRVGIAEQLDRYAALEARHPDRLRMHVAIDHRRPECLALCRRAVKALGFVGIGEITPDGFRISDPELRPLMHLAADLGVPVQVHTRAGTWNDMHGHDFTASSTTHPRWAAELAREVPALTLVLCHAGYPHWWQAAAEEIADLPNCVLELSDWNEALDHPEEIGPRLACWRRLVGAERILFGSDQVSGPRFTGDRSRLGEWVRLIAELPERAAALGYRFTATEADRILGDNVRRVYRLGGPAARASRA